MEGAPKNRQEVATREHSTEENSLSVEQLQEQVELAQEKYAELQALDGVEMSGPDAMVAMREADDLAKQLSEVLYHIPPAVCLKNGLPYHPTDAKAEVTAPSLPDTPDYPLNYKPVASPDGARVDQERV